VHDVALLLFEKLPAAHAVHVRSVVVVPRLLENEPGRHVVMFVQAETLSAVLNVAAAQTEHERSEVVVPATLTNWPAMQLVHGTHAVAALLSWSHVPVGQAMRGRIPPPQKPPAAQAEHVGGEVNVPGAV